MSVSIMRGLIDCVRCGAAPQNLFQSKKTGQHFCKRCLDKEYKKTPKMKLVGVPDEPKRGD